MQSKRYWSLFLMALLALMLAGCGGSSSSSDDDSDTPAESGTEVSGTASAAPNQVALLEQKNLFEVALEFVVPPLAAAMTGLDPIQGASVELIRVDNEGNQIGEVIATTTTSVTGHYTLRLPADVNLAGDLVVRIGSMPGAQLRAQVVSRSVNITPVSEYVLKKFIERGTDLNSLSPDTVVSISGKVEEFDIAAQGGENIDALLARLEADAGDYVNSQIDLAVSGPADGASLDGVYYSTNMTLVLGDSDDGSPGTFETQVFKDIFALDAQGAGVIEVINTGGLTLFAQMRGSDNNSATVYKGVDIGDGESETFDATYMDNNVVTIQAPFHEEVEPENNTGFRAPATDFRLQPVPGMGLMFSAPSEVLVRYALTDTDAVDANNKLGEELKRGIEAFIRTPTAATNADLTGAFGRVYLSTTVSDGGQIEAEAEASTITFDGAGHFTNAASPRYRFTRANNASVQLVTEQANSGSASYTLASDGTISFGGDPTAYIDESFSFVAVANLDEATNNLGTTLLLKKPATTPEVSGKQYRIMSAGLGLGLGQPGNISLIGSRFDSELTMGTVTAGETEATRDLSISVVTKTSLEGQINLTQLKTSQAADVTVGNHGETTIVVVDGERTTTYEGFFNTEGSLGVFMVRVNEGENDANQLGLAVLIEKI